MKKLAKRYPKNRKTQKLKKTAAIMGLRSLNEIHLDLYLDTLELMNSESNKTIISTSWIEKLPKNPKTKVLPIWRLQEMRCQKASLMLPGPLR